MVKKSGFTLAEVLVTLTIIGTVAAMTVPSLMNSTATQENTAAYKKMISTLNQAITMQYALEGTDMRDIVFINEVNEQNPALSLQRMLEGRLQVVRTIEGRGDADGHPQQDGNPQGNTALVLSDGSIIEIPSAVTRTTTCEATWRREDLEVNPAPGQIGGFRTATNNTCLYSILVDVNGNKGNCVLNNDSDADIVPNDMPEQLPMIRDCFWLDVYPTEVRPGDWTGRMIMYNNSRPMDDSASFAPNNNNNAAGGDGGDGGGN